MESEVAVARDVSEDSARLIVPILLRVGVVERLELRAESDLLTLQGPLRGTSDVSVGVKWNFSDQPNLGLLTQFTIPAGPPELRSEALQTTVRLLADIPLSEEWEMRLNLGAVSAVSEGQRQLLGEYGLVVFQNFGERVETHLEYGHLSPARSLGAAPTQLVDAGLAVKITENLHWDLAFFKGLATNTRGLDWKFTTGVAVRF